MTETEIPEPVAEQTREKLLATVSELQARIVELEATATLRAALAPAPSRAEDYHLARCLDQSLDCVGLFSSVRNAAGEIVDFRIDYLNSAACENNCLPLDQQLGRNLCELLPAHRELGIFEKYRQVVLTGVPAEIDSFAYSDDYGDRKLSRAFDIRAFKFEDGFAAIWRDVTARKQVEDDLRHQRNLLRNVLDSTQDAIFVKDRDGRFVLMNRSGAAFAGHSPQELIGKTDRELFPQSPAEWLAKTAEADRLAIHAPEGEVIRREHLMQTSVGVRRFVTRKTSFRDESGKVIGVLGFARDTTAEAKVQQELVESRERLRAALFASGTGTFRWNIVTNEVTWDENLDRLFGLPPGQTVQNLENFVSLVHADDRAGVIRCCQQCIETGADFDLEFRAAWPDGTIRWLHDKGRTFFDPEGKPLYMTGACVDTTERRRMEDALRESEQRFRELADAMPQIVWMADSRGQLLYFNRRWTEYTGLSLEESLGLDSSQALHPDDVGHTLELWRQAVETQEPFEMEYRFRSREGDFRWQLARAVPVRDAHGRTTGWFGTSTDIHEHRRTLEELQAKQAQLSLMHGAVGAGSFSHDMQTNGTWWSPELEQLYGLPIGSFGGDLDAWKRCVVPDDLDGALQALHVSRESGAFRSDFRIRRPDGTVRWIHARGHVIRDEQGRARRLEGINLDVTDQKLAEEAMRVAREGAERANQAKDDFLAALSHELRTPLTPVLMTAQLLEHDTSLPDSTREDLRNIRRNVEIETRLIDDLLDLTRISRGKLPLQLETVDLHEVVTHALETSRDDMFASKRLSLQLDLGASRTQISADRARLSQVFWNLIKNAVKFTGPDGTVQIRTLDLQNDHVMVEVTDSGIGIEADVLPFIFNAFEQGSRDVTRRFGGLGLGLAICKTLTELHGGYIAASSGGRGTGATFTIGLPLATARHAQAPEPRDPRPVKAAPGSDSGYILLVEDHEQTGRILSRLLTRLGYRVTWAESVARAMEAAEAERPDLVVSDLGLPDGTGHELMQQLRDRYGLRGIALSGYGMEQDIARSSEAGFVDHLIKPVNFETLETLVRRAIS